MLAHTCYLRDPRVRREAEALAETGVDVHVICLSEYSAAGVEEPRTAVVRGVRLHRLPIRRKRGSLARYFYEYLATALLGALKLTTLHVSGRLDVVHVHNMPDLLVLAAIVPSLTGAKVVLDVHDPMPELFMSWDGRASNRLLVGLLRLQERLSCAFADRIVSVNESMRDNLEAKGNPPTKIFILNNFPDQTLFPFRELPVVWPQHPDRLVVLYCGTVTEHYDVGLAVRAIAKLRTEMPVTLRILGEGNKLNEVLDLASTLGVRESVEHLGLVPVDRVLLEMRKADVGISCHRAGLFGDLYFSTKIVEYLTQSLPVLSPRTKTIRKYLPEDCIFYFEPGSEDSLVERLRFIWANRSEVVHRLATARGLLPQLSWQAEKSKFVSFYAGVMGDAAEPASLPSEVASPSRGRDGRAASVDASINAKADQIL